MKAVGIAVMSLDGCITRHEESGASFSSNEDRAYFHETLKAFDCSIVGSGTFEAGRAGILKSLGTERLRVVWTRNPAAYSGLETPDRLEFKNGDLNAIFAELSSRGRSNCAILGGAAVYTECIRLGLMDELWLTVEPLGLGSGKRLFIGEVDFRFSLENMEALSKNTLLLKYRVRGNDARAPQT
jgi:dihydrofolate reductase